MAKKTGRLAPTRTATLKKKGDRGGVNPGTAGTRAGAQFTPANAITGGQSSADPIGQRKKTTRAIGYNEH